MRHGDLVRAGLYYCVLCDLSEPARSECFKGPLAIERYRRGYRRGPRGPAVENIVRPLAEIPRDELEAATLRWLLERWQIKPAPWLVRMLRPELDATWRFFDIPSLEERYRTFHLKSPGPMRLRKVLPTVGAVMLSGCGGRSRGAKWWALPSKDSIGLPAWRKLTAREVLRDLSADLGGPSDPNQISPWCRGHPQEAMVRQLLRESDNPRQRFEEALSAILARGERLSARAIREQLGQTGPPTLSQEERGWRDEFLHALEFGTD